MLHDPITGRFTGPSQTNVERFWPKVRKTEGCWLWTGALTKAGYGLFGDGKQLVYAHRFAYELLVGAIEPGKEIDHLCRTPACCNPKHLEVVDHRTNCQRGETGKKSGEQQKAKTHCPKGHPYDEENTYITPSTGARCCRTCRKEWSQAHSEEATARMRRWRASRR